MFVTRARYDRAVQEGVLALRKYHQLIREWNDLVDLIDNLGGLKRIREAVQATPTQQFTDDDIRRLLQLCHPDKHANSNLAQDMTRKLLAARQRKTG